MPERPPAIKRLDSLLGAVTIAHEIIFEMRRELIEAIPSRLASSRSRRKS